jgi:hypothetical protein
LLRLRELGEDIVSLRRKPFCRLGDITVVLGRFLNRDYSGYLVPTS